MNEINSLITTITADLREAERDLGGLSVEELALVKANAEAFRDLVFDLKRDGTFRRRSSFAARHIVERFGGFDQEAPTAEYEPTRAMLNALADAGGAQ